MKHFFITHLLKPSKFHDRWTFDPSTRYVGYLKDEWGDVAWPEGFASMRDVIKSWIEKHRDSDCNPSAVLRLSDYTTLEVFNIFDQEEQVRLALTYP